MKKKILLAVLMLALSAAQSWGFSLGSYVGPIELKVAGYTASGDTTFAAPASVAALGITSPTGGTPGETWGVFSLSAITDGTNNLWSQTSHDNVYGILYGLYDHAYNTGSATIEQVGGHFALFTSTTPLNLTTLNPTVGHTADNLFTGITVGAPILTGDFVSGIIPGSPATIAEDVNALTAPTTGSGHGYGDVTGGTMANVFNTNSQPGFTDLLFDFTVKLPGAGNLWSQHIDDPVVGAAAPVPEPGTMALLGFGMLGFAVYGKRRSNKA